MKKFIIFLTYSTLEDLDLIPESQRKKVLVAINRLTRNPFASGIHTKKLKAFKPPLYRMRSGNYRVIYRIDDTIITIMRVIDRKNLEKIIKRLNLLS